MGRSKKKGRRGRGGDGGGGDPAGGDRAYPAPQRVSNWEVVKENANFTRYYKAQNILPENEWDEFLTHLRNPLPTTFRVTGSRATAQDLNDFIKTTHIPHLSGIVFDGQQIEPPKQISWYPNGLGWQLNISKSVLRKSEEFRKFQNFLVYETEVGNISRQEAVSIIPPLLLDVEPHHNVMDMCAAPGSKSAQLLEALHAEDSAAVSATPSGVLIANDSDYKRTHMLAHQTGRLASPALMVTNLDASLFPAIKIPLDPGETASRGQVLKSLFFDRVLCDVPCSGDGTLRKNVNIWKDWVVTNGNGLHGLQLRILLRGMKLLKQGGRLVYSTCSLNPVENEAVIAAALNASSAEFKLVDVSERLPQLFRRPGLSTWTVSVDKNVTCVDTYAAYESKTADKKVSRTCWPPENAQELNLHRCLRIYPHDQDTGAFFVAVLEKASQPGDASGRGINRPAAKSDGRAEQPSASTSLKRGADEEADGQPEHKRNRMATDDDVEHAERETGGAFHEDPYTYLSGGNEQIQECMRSLHIRPSFPADRLFVRNPKGDALRSIYLTNDIIKTILQHNEYTKLRLVNCGTKVLSHHDTGQSAKKFRFLDDGVALVLPHVEPDAVLNGTVKDLRVLMQGYNPKFEEFDEQFRSQAAGKEPGSYLVRFEPEESDEVSLRQALVLPMWGAKDSMGLLIDKKARSALSLRVFGADISPAGREEVKKRNVVAETPALGVVDSINDSVEVDIPDDDVVVDHVND